MGVEVEVEVRVGVGEAGVDGGGEGETLEPPNQDNGLKGMTLESKSAEKKLSVIETTNMITGIYRTYQLPPSLTVSCTA